MKTYLVTWIFLAGIFFLPTHGWSKQVVRVGIYQNNPKVGMSESGQAEGIFVDLIEAIARNEEIGRAHV